MPSNQQVVQVEDDLDLLRLMVEDMRRASSLYQPTNYWAYYEKKILPELETLGLKDFRRRENSVLCSFGAATRARRPPLNYPILRQLPASVRGRLSEAISRTQFYRRRRCQAIKTYVQHADRYGRERGAHPITKTYLPLVGNPPEAVCIDGRYYDVGLVYYYLLYAWTCRWVNYDSVTLYAELGPGLGTQAMLFKQLYASLTVLLFDLPTQLYVCEQYLKKVFPDRVVSYREARDIRSLKECRPGWIHILGTFQFPLLATGEVDLFWNAASFQEMEPDVVLNYLSFVRGARWVVLREALYGKHVAQRPGESGVLERTTYVHYINALSPTHSLRALEPSVHFEDPELTELFYNDSIWERKATNSMPAKIS